MNVSLTTQLEAFIQEKVDSGQYRSASEVVREALRLLWEQNQARQLRLDRLRQEIAAGIEEADRGDLIEGENVFAGLRARGEARPQSES